MTAERCRDHYPSNVEKRWHVSEDEKSRERIGFLKEVHDYLKKEVPGITIAMTLFGSLSKGKELTVKNTRDSDIDLEVFIDNEELEANFNKILRECPESEFKKYVRRTTLSSEIKPANMYPFLKAFIKSTFNNRLPNKEYIEMLSIGFRTISLDGDESILGRAEKAYCLRPVDDDPASGLWSIAMSRFFHLDVGGSMKKYKEDFYIKLAKMLAEGKEEAKHAKSIWHHLVKAMKVEERYDERLPEGLRTKYPNDNLEEFLKKRGIEIPQQSS